MPAIDRLLVQYPERRDRIEALRGASDYEVNTLGAQFEKEDQKQRILDYLAERGIDVSQTELADLLGVDVGDELVTGFKSQGGLLSRDIQNVGAGGSTTSGLTDDLRSINETYARNNLLGSSSHRRALAQAELDSLRGGRADSSTYGVFYR